MTSFHRRFGSSRDIARAFILWLLLTQVNLCAQQAVPEAADPQVHGETESAERLSIVVRDVEIQSFSSLDTIRGQIVARLTITNKTQSPISLTSSQFRMDVEKSTAVFNAAVPDPLLVGDTELAPQAVRSGAIAFSLNYPSSAEPGITLRWTDGAASVALDLNDEVRRLAKLSVSRMGPGNCLAVVEMQRSVDHFGVWLLTEQFVKLKREGLERVVLQVAGRDEPTSSYSLRSSISAWLLSVSSQQEARRFPFAAQVRSPVQFESFYVVGMSSKTTPTGYLLRRGNIFQSERDRAIADSLRDTYTRVPLQTALRDLNHSEPGVRMVAVEANIDRLTKPQLQELIQQAAKRPSEYQAMIAENLFRVAFPSVANTLASLVLSEHLEVSSAAIRSLVQSASPESVAALTKIWREHAGDTVRPRIVTAILTAKDHRYTDLLAEYATDQLTRFSSSDSLPDQNPQQGDGATATAKTIGSHAAASPPDQPALQKILLFLAQYEHLEFAAVARHSLLTITDESVQDVVANYILNAADFGDEPLLRAFVEQRLPPADTAEPGEGLTREQKKELNRRLGPRSTSARTRISMVVLNAVKRFPDASYTDRLADLSDAEAISSSVRNQIFRAMLRCASHQQLEEIIDGFEDYDRSKRSELLNQLAVMNHPRWLELARVCLDSDESSQNMVLGKLRSQGSPEAIDLIVESLERIRIRAEAGQELETGDYRLAQRIFSHLQSITYPAARRAVNRCHRSAVLKLSSMASASIQEMYRTFFRSTAHREDILEAFNLRKAGDYEGAIEAYNDILQKEPFYAGAFVSRASLNLRTGSPQLAMADLQYAAELNPEDPVTESIMAIAQIRLGNITEGIQAAEEILAEIPDLPTMVRRDTIYNTACVYGRAMESSTDAKVKEQYTDRALELLTDCIDREGGFDDVDHLLDDPDLAMFHDHPRWDDLVTRVRQNQENQPKP